MHQLHIFATFLHKVAKFFIYFRYALYRNAYKIRVQGASFEPYSIFLRCLVLILRKLEVEKSKISFVLLQILCKLYKGFEGETKEI